jgi:hypothetical protein
LAQLLFTPLYRLNLELLKLCHKWRFNHSEIREEDINRMHILYEKWKDFRNKQNLR